MYSRRNFVKTLTAGATGILALNPLDLLAQFSGKKLENIGYITGILGRNLGERDWKSILKKTAEFGYTEIETGNFLGDSAASYLAYLKEIGLKPIAGNVGFTSSRDELRSSLDRLASLEMKYGISYWPWNGGGPFKLDDCKRSTDILNQMGEECKSRGITFCWHNHDQEFKPMEEGLPFDYLMEHTDPSLVQCQLDIYWTRKGGADPVTVLKQYPGRYPILHVKDMAPGAEQDFACPGSGIIDWKAVFAESTGQGIKHYFVERDNEVDGLGCLKGSAEYLLALRF
jgi:sugar phosphate isomerase/epimerase